MSGVFTQVTYLEDGRSRQVINYIIGMVISKTRMCGAIFNNSTCLLWPPINIARLVSDNGYLHYIGDLLKQIRPVEPFKTTCIPNHLS